jgi:hypothetical protein
MPTRTCWNCRVLSNMKLPQLRAQYLYDNGTRLMDCTFPKPEDWHGDEDDFFVVYVCANCGYPNIAHYLREESSLDEGVDHDDPEEWIPAFSIGKEYSDVPETVANAASEAYECFSIGAYRAAVITARSVLEAIATENISSPANDRGKDKGLKEKLKNLVDEGIVSSQLGEYASAIKDIGDGSTHNIFESVTKDEASYILDFLDMIIDEVYQRNAKLKKLAAKSQEFSHAKETKLLGFKH